MIKYKDPKKFSVYLVSINKEEQNAYTTYHTKGYIFRKGKKREPPKSYIEASTVDNMYFRIDVYYATQCYTMYFKKEKDD